MKKSVLVAVGLVLSTPAFAQFFDKDVTYESIKGDDDHLREVKIVPKKLVVNKVDSCKAAILKQQEECNKTEQAVAVAVADIAQ